MFWIAWHYNILSLKKIIGKNFSLVFFCFICCMRERKNPFNNENEVITVSCFFLENYFHDKKLQLYIMHLMAIKVKCVCLLLCSLPDLSGNGLVGKLNYMVKILTSVVSSCFHSSASGISETAISGIWDLAILKSQVCCYTTSLSC